MNSLPGIGSHQSQRPSSDEWLTPPFILEALGPFDLDPCAPVMRPWPMAAHHFTIEDNGLFRDWWGRVWLNPPYGQQTGKWLERLVSHGRGTALIFARTETRFFFRTVWEKANAVFFLYQRLHFHYVDGSAARFNSGAPSVLVAYGREDADALAGSSLEGKFIPLQVPRFVALMAAAEAPSWREAVLSVLNRRRGPVPLDELYRALSDHPKTAGNRHWQAKVRQVLQEGPFRRVERGVWELDEVAA